MQPITVGCYWPMTSSTPIGDVVGTQGHANDGSESPLVPEDYEIFGQEGNPQLLQVNLSPKACITTDIDSFVFSGGLVRLRSVPALRTFEHFIRVGLPTHRLAVFENESSTTKAYIGLSPRFGGYIMKIPLRDTGPMLMISGSFLCGLSEVKMTPVPATDPSSNPCVFRISGQGTAFVGTAGFGCFRRLIEGESIRVAIPAVLGFTEGCTVASGGEGSDRNSWRYFKYPSTFGSLCDGNSASTPYLVFTGPGTVYMQSSNWLPKGSSTLEKTWRDGGPWRQGSLQLSCIAVTCFTSLLFFNLLWFVIVMTYAVRYAPEFQILHGHE